MAFDLSKLLGVLPVVGPVIAAAPQFKELFDAGMSLLKNDDQETAKSAYQDLIANNAEGHARLQAKLAEAAKR